MPARNRLLRLTIIVCWWVVGWALAIVIVPSSSSTATVDRWFWHHSAQGRAHGVPGGWDVTLSGGVTRSGHGDHTRAIAIADIGPLVTERAGWLEGLTTGGQPLAVNVVVEHAQPGDDAVTYRLRIVDPSQGGYDLGLPDTISQAQLKVVAR